MFNADSTRRVPDVKSDLLRLSAGRLAKTSSLSPKGKANLLVETLGLKACFAPYLVRETVVKHSKYGKVSVSTGRDGRMLWVSTTGKALKYLNEGEGKFSSPWNGVTRTQKLRAGKLSYISTIIAEEGLREEVIKPLTRLAFQFWKLKDKDFKGLCRSIVTPYSKTNQIRRMTARYRLQSKPWILRDLGEKTLPKVMEGKVPFWDWRPI